MTREGLNMKRLAPKAGILALVVALTSCADLSPTAQRTMTGAGGGAAAGAVIGALAGNAGLGAAIGAGTGAAGGFIWDRHVQSVENARAQGFAAGQASQP